MRIYPALIMRIAKWITPVVFALTPMFACAAPMIIQTTGGRVPADQTGLMLPHEHIVTDLRGPTAPGYGQVDVEDVVRVMKPNLVAAKTKGVDVLVECSPIGVGRNIPVSTRMANETGLRIVVPTGVYDRASFTPAEYQAMSEDELANWMIAEITDEIENTGVKAGFIKLACDATPLTEFQKRMLRAAARASLRTGVAIAIHTPGGARAMDQANLLEAAGVSLSRFIWVHAQSESDLNVHKQLAARGVYIEYDSIRDNTSANQQTIKDINSLVAEGYGDRILLSQDSGWYQPGSTDGGTQTPYTYLVDNFIPAMRSGGADDDLIRRLTVENPRRAFAIPKPPSSGEQYR